MTSNVTFHYDSKKLGLGEKLVDFGAQYFNYLTNLLNQKNVYELNPKNYMVNFKFRFLGSLWWPKFESSEAKFQLKSLLSNRYFCWKMSENSYFISKSGIPKICLVQWLYQPAFQPLNLTGQRRNNPLHIKRRISGPFESQCSIIYFWCQNIIMLFILSPVANNSFLKHRALQSA